MCDLENALPFEELEQRRKKASKIREAVQAPAHQNELTDSEAINVVREIFNPSLKLPETKGPYKLPDEVTADDVDILTDLDVRKLAELKEVFLLFDTDCDGLISKDDLRFTLTALGDEATEELLENMLNEAKDPLDVNAFVELMSYRTVELDPEDVLLEAWSKWDIYGTGKIDEKNCSDYIELFPYLRGPAIDNTTCPDYVVCNQTTVENHSTVETEDIGYINAKDLHEQKFFYSSARVFGIRVRFGNTKERKKDWLFNISGEYRFLKKENFKNDGRLIESTFCDYYFFANADRTNETRFSDIWKYFHSPRFPANYPAHIKCAYKFIGSPDTHVEIVFEELQLPRQEDGCGSDKISIFDSESTNTHEIDVICEHTARHIFSSGPDLLIEFNASSNVTAKGFRAKFKFIHNEVIAPLKETQATATERSFHVGKLISRESADTRNAEEWFKSPKSNGKCKHVFDSRENKSNFFQTSHMNCRYEFYGLPEERVQIRFHDFYIPTDSRNSSECNLSDSLQLLNIVRGKPEVIELFCGAFIPKPIMSDGPTMLLQFSGKLPTAENRLSYYGFKAEYRFLTNFGITTGKQLNNNCTFAYNSTERKSGSFYSPNFPGIYPKNILCNYFFFGEPNEEIVLLFTYFDVEGVGDCEDLSASDYVEFSSFMTIDRKFRRHCGKREKFQMRSGTRFFRVAFYTNDRFDKTGFRALYDFEVENNAVGNTSTQSFTSKAALKSISMLHRLLLITAIFFCEYLWLRQ